ncbi:hypothetical protein [Acetilactobacillus jinshanensis]|uniref:Uncharacterized protein n=1 Tax=Acetilactobacillus jinshanensis TaxID=1720083 RepID=A0A4P6ZP44_9LACO|nr:hypothetical protein [Acetilactobacillus jinshanensis]QBP18920.1 hypothetical protein ELX58_07465 [Acetilactobacillus jinshanensis]URL60530.1 hypothetical protein HGK75_00330 [uncultured bacterium]
MQMDADQLIQQIDNKKFATQTKSVRKTTLTKNFSKAVQPMIKFMIQNLNDHQAAQANVKVMSTEMVISLEVNVINLPYTSIRPMKRLITNDGKMMANVYVMIADPDVNRSKFRLDQVASVDDFIKHPDDDVAFIKNWLADQVKKIKANQEYAKKHPKAKKTKKTTRARRTKRTYRKKRTRRTYRRRTSRRKK